KADAVVSWSGPTDLTQNPTSATKTYVGCSLGSCRPAWLAASPLYQVDATDAPTYIANSQSEKPVPVSEADDMANALQSAGVPYQLTILPGSLHARAYESTVWSPSLAFLSQHLGSTRARIRTTSPGPRQGHAGQAIRSGATPTWTAATGGRVLSSPAVANGLVYIGSEDGHLYAFDATTGALVWSEPLGAPTEAAPTLSSSSVFIGAQDGNVHAFNAITGTPL